LAPPPGPAAPAGPPQFGQVLNHQFGEGNPFAPQTWYGGNPLETARDMANREFDKKMAALSAQSAPGGGQSSRAALASGTALGEYGTGLADVLATRGQEARNADVNRVGNLMLGAGQQDLTAQGLGLENVKTLGDLGKLVTAIGGSEQAIPDLNALLQWFSQHGKSRGKSKTTQHGRTKSGFQA